MHNTTRRDFMVKMGAAALGAATASTLLPKTALARTAAPGKPAEATPHEAARNLLKGLKTGETFGAGWTLEALHGPIAGGLTLVLREGKGSRPIRVDLCLMGDDVKAPVSTEYLELYVMDGGGGNACMEESLSSALERLARVIRKNEQDPRLLEGLLTFEDRWDLYPDYMARAAIELEPGVEFFRDEKP